MNIVIGNKKVGGEKPAFIIAEIGSNHDGKLSQARKLVDIAQKCGADAVKFQAFKAEHLVCESHKTFKQLQHLELPLRWNDSLKKYADTKRIVYLCTPFDKERAVYLNKIKIPAFKIASGDITYLPLIKRIAQFKKPIILSTGMATVKEVKAAIKVIMSAGNNKIVLLHCVSNYPARYKDMNLKVMDTLKKMFKLPVGLSDHSLGIHIALAAVSLGASVIEKHITLNRKSHGPDHSFALEPDEFKAMVRCIRDIEAARGGGNKAPCRAELMERKWARRGVYTKNVIARGSTITLDQLKFVRPCIGMSTAELDAILARKSGRTLKKETPITRNKII